jgi:hypothetical protein
VSSCYVYYVMIGGCSSQACSGRSVMLYAGVGWRIAYLAICISALLARQHGDRAQDDVAHTPITVVDFVMLVRLVFVVVRG